MGLAEDTAVLPPTPKLGGRQNDIMEGLAQAPRDPPARAPRPSRLGKWNDGPQETPDSAGPGPRAAQDSAFPREPPPSSPLGRTAARMGVGQGSGWRMGRGACRSPKPPSPAHPRVRRDIPPARAAPRSPARRLSPEREPGRGQSAGCFGRSEPRGRAGRLQRARRSHRRSQELQLPPARAEALSYLPPSASAPPGPGARAGGRACGRGLGEAGPGEGGAAPGQGRLAGGAQPEP